MTRVKGGLLHSKRRRNILKHTKGFRWGRKSKMKVAKVAKMKAGQYAFVSRRVKKRTNRRLWSVHINAAARLQGTTYSKLISDLKKRNIAIDRKILSKLAIEYPKVFSTILTQK